MEPPKQPADTLVNAPGTAAAGMYAWHDSASSRHTLDELLDANDTLFVQQWLQQQLRATPTPSIVGLVRSLPPHMDRLVWATEHVRVILSNLNELAVLLDQEG